MASAEIPPHVLTSKGDKDERCFTSNPNPGCRLALFFQASELHATKLNHRAKARQNLRDQPAVILKEKVTDSYLQDAARWTLVHI
jgi:hypothetical protein